MGGWDCSSTVSSNPSGQDWAPYYVNGQSDVDFVVEMRKNVAPQEIVKRIIDKGCWRVVGEVYVHKFASTQFTLVGSPDREEYGTIGKVNEDCSQVEERANDAPQEIYLDITCIEHPRHYKNFKKRQEAFQQVFFDVRLLMESQYSEKGALAFDAYIHLLKAFAAKVPGNALTGFQATCIGLFTLQIGHYRTKFTQSLALSLFEGFLLFCTQFFGAWYDGLPGPQNYQHFALDLCSGGRWLQRQWTGWRSEIYFVAAERSLGNRLNERMNIAHSLEPEIVAKEAQSMLCRAFAPSPTG